MASTEDYPFPVSQVLNHGPLLTSAEEPWFDYVGRYGLGERDVPLLIMMAQGIDVDWAIPQQREAHIHACRALGLLGDRAAASYLVRLLDEDEDSGLVETVVVALGLLGGAALEDIRAYFYAPDTSHWSQALAADAVQQIALRHTKERERCVQFLRRALSQYQRFTPELNASLIRNLVALRVVAARRLIEQVFRSGRVETGISDEWEQVQVELGGTGKTMGAKAGPQSPLSSETGTIRRQTIVDQGMKASPIGGYSILDYLKRR